MQTAISPQVHRAVALLFNIILDHSSSQLDTKSIWCSMNVNYRQNNTCYKETGLEMSWLDAREEGASSIHFYLLDRVLAHQLARGSN